MNPHTVRMGELKVVVDDEKAVDVSVPMSVAPIDWPVVVYWSQEPGGGVRLVPLYSRPSDEERKESASGMTVRYDPATGRITEMELQADQAPEAGWKTLKEQLLVRFKNADRKQQNINFGDDLLHIMFPPAL